jgi:hypothetical protein
MEDMIQERGHRLLRMVTRSGYGTSILAIERPTLYPVCHPIDQHLHLAGMYPGCMKVPNHKNRRIRKTMNKLKGLTGVEARIL